jgi:hypothetical protein
MLGILGQNAQYGFWTYVMLKSHTSLCFCVFRNALVLDDTPPFQFPGTRLHSEVKCTRTVFTLAHTIGVVFSCL